MAIKFKLPGIKNVIGIMSGKGGVGKTFVTTNLALTLAKSGKKIGILDADISCPNLYKMLGITSKIVPTADNKIIPAEKWGIKAVSMAGLCGSDDEPIAWRGPILSKIIQQLLKESIWGELDCLFIDFPSGTSDAEITILQNFAVDGIMIVTTPQALAMMDARRTINSAAMLKVPLVGIVENMRGDIFGEGGANRLAETYHTSFLASIPLRKAIVSQCDNGQPTVFNSEEIEMIFLRIARALENKWNHQEIQKI
ncbi:MAG: Mrp/NBP35 family ATP-binding protein [Patescibacteria group bacterium]